LKERQEKRKKIRESLKSDPPFLVSYFGTVSSKIEG